MLIPIKRAIRRQLFICGTALLTLPSPSMASHVYPDGPVDLWRTKMVIQAYNRNENILASAEALKKSREAHRVKKSTSIAELETAIKTAVPGDTLLLADGTYDLAQDIEVSVCGKEKASIVIAAAPEGRAILTGKGGFSLKKPACYIEIHDFVFRNASSRIKSGIGTAHCRWSHNIFETTGKGEDLTLAGDNQEVDHNSFLNKDAMGRFLAIRGEGSQIAQGLWIHHNYFAHYRDQGGKNGAEAFQFGLSGFSMSTSNSLVEYNLFEDCNGEAELISVKASGVVLRYNTFRDSKAQFTLRHGNHCVVYGNYFFKTPGIRFFGDNHLIYSNYFENCPLAIQIGNGDGEVTAGAKLTCHDRPDSVFVGFNTLVNNKAGIVFDARREGLGATDIQIAANLIQGGGPVAKIEQGGGALLRPVWTDNVFYNNAGAGDLPIRGKESKSGNRMEDPKMKRVHNQRPAIDNVGDTDAIYHLSKRSPVLLLSQEVPTLFSTGKTADIDGQPRKGPLNIGADELSDAPIINFPLNRPAPGLVGVND